MPSRPMSGWCSWGRTSASTAAHSRSPAISSTKCCEKRVIDTPISELGGAGVAVGAAMSGLWPIFEFQFSDFAALSREQIVNQAAKIRYMLGGTVSVPVVMRLPARSGTGAAKHSPSKSGSAMFRG